MSNFALVCLILVCLYTCYGLGDYYIRYKSAMGDVSEAMLPAATEKIQQLHTRSKRDQSRCPRARADYLEYLSAKSEIAIRAANRAALKLEDPNLK